MDFNLEEFKNSSGQHVEPEIVTHISNHFYVSTKALNNMKLVDKEHTLVYYDTKTKEINYVVTNLNVKKALKNYEDAIFTPTGTIKIILNKDSFFVAALSEDKKQWCLSYFSSSFMVRPKVKKTFKKPFGYNNKKFNKQTKKESK